MKKFKKSKRDFITDDRAQSVIRYYISYDPPKMVKHWDTGEKVLGDPRMHNALHMTDCYKSISWDFSDDDALPKLKKARKLLNEFFTRAEEVIKEHDREQRRVNRLRGRSNSTDWGDI